jgi:uncharacterized protein DUF3153
LLLTGCEIRVTTEVDARGDGSGVVRAGVGLDREALRDVPDLPNRLRVDDLRKAGWEITGPAAEKDGRTWVRAVKRFATPAEANRVVRELSGPTGPFQNFRLTQKRSLLRTTTKFRGVVDLREGANGFTDAELRERLGVSDLGLGLDQQTIQRRLGLVFNRIFRVQVVTRLPGTTESNAPTEAADGVLWTPKLGERASLEATSRAWNTSTIVFGVLALAAAAGFGLVLRHNRTAASP